MAADAIYGVADRTGRLHRHAKTDAQDLAFMHQIIGVIVKKL